MKYQCFLLLFICSTQLVSCQNQTLSKYNIVIKEQIISVEIAVTEEARAKGLMGRKEMSPDSGMLFIFRGQEQYLQFWMKDTGISLSIAFIKADGIISEIRFMQPLSEEVIHSREPVKYALEMEQGWFKSYDIGEGDKIHIPQGIKNVNVE